MTTDAAAPTTDFRTQKMPSREGWRKAWDAYAGAMNRLSERGLLPGITPTARRLALEMILSRGGFWLVWQLEGGFEGMRRLGLSDASIYRKIKAFREAFGEHPDEFKMPGVTIDVEEFQRWYFDPATKTTKRRAEPE